MWLRLSTPPRRAVPVTTALLLVFMGLHLLAILSLGVVRADSARSDLVLERSGPRAAELTDDGQAPAPDARSLRSSVVLPTSRGDLTWTRVVPWSGQVEVPGVAAAELVPGTVLLSPAAEQVVESDGHLRWLAAEGTSRLPSAALGGPDELVVISVLPRSAVDELGPFQQLPLGPEEEARAVQPPVPPPSATPVALLLLLGAVLSTLGLARLAALSRGTALATLRLVGMTQRDIRGVLVIQTATLSLAAGVLVAPIALALGSSGASVRFLAVRYGLSELVPGVVAVGPVVLAIVLASAVVSVVGLRRLEAEPLAVRLRRRRELRGARVPLLWLAGFALLAGAAFAASRGGVPDIPLVVLEVLGLAAVVAGLAGTMAALVAFGGRALRAPLAAFLAGRHLSADPRTAVRTVFAVGGLALAVGLAAAVGPASHPAASVSPWGSAMSVTVPDGDARAVATEVGTTVPVDRVATFTSEGFSVAGTDEDLQLFTGTCAGLEATGTTVADGACREGQVVHVGAGPPPVTSVLDGIRLRAADGRPASLQVSGVAVGPAQPWLFLATASAPASPDTMVVRTDGQDEIVGAVLAAATRSGVAFEADVPALRERSEALANAGAQAEVDALGAWLVLLAAVAAMAGAVVAVIERRSSLTSLRYAGLGRGALAVSVAITLAGPLALVAAFGGLNGYVIGAVFGAVLDGRAPGPASGALTAIGLLLAVAAVLGCLVGSVVAAGARPQPQDARLG